MLKLVLLWQIHMHVQPSYNTVKKLIMTCMTVALFGASVVSLLWQSTQCSLQMEYQGTGGRVVKDLGS